MTDELKLLLMPGLDGTGELFEPLLDALPPGVSAEVLSYPVDEVASYEKLAGRLSARLPLDERFVLVAESFSGPLAIMLAAQRPAGLCGLVLCATFVRSPLRPPTNTLLALLARPLGRITPPSWLRRRLLFDTASPPDLPGRLAALSKRVQPEVLATRFSSIAQVDVSELARLIDVPVLYLHAVRDRLVTERSLEEVRACFTALRVVPINAPHLVLQCAAERSAAVIDEFCAELQAALSLTSSVRLS